MFLWLKIKLEILAILYYQKRFEDCGDMMAIARMECQAVNEQMFQR